MSVNGIQLKSQLNKWDLSSVAKNIVNGSNKLGSKLQPLYFTKTGSTVLLQTKIEYTTELVDGVEYQPDLMGGFVFSDGINTGWLVARGTGIVTTGWKYQNGLVKDEVLTMPAKRPVTLTVALKNDIVYIFFNNNFVYETRISKIIPGVESGAKLAFGLTMVADKTADIKFSNISISTDLKDVDEYLSAHKK